MLHYIIRNLTFILPVVCNLLKSNNGKVKLEKARLWQLDNSSREDCQRC